MKWLSVSSVLLCFLCCNGSLKAQDFCEIYNQVPGVSDCFDNGTSFGFTLDACRSARIEFDGEAGVFRINDQVYDFDGPSDYENYWNYITNLCGTGSTVGFSNGSYSDPVVNQSLQNVLGRTLQSRLVPQEVKANGAPGQALRMMTGNVGGGSFSSNGIDGRSSGAQFGYALEWESGYSLGTHVSYNKLSFDSGQNDLVNTGVNIYAEKQTELLGFKGAYGLGYNHLFLDDSLGDDGQGINLYYSGIRMFGDHQLTGDIQFQFNKAGDLEQQMATVTTAYGIPIGDRGALNADLTFVKTDQKWNGQSLPTDDMFAVSGLVYDYYLGDFVIKVGARKVLMLDGYSNLDYVLSGGLRY